MLKSVLNVSKELRKICAPKDLTIEQIVSMFRNLTALDKIYFVDFDTPPENPIWGEFTRWLQRPGVYSPMETAVEIRYAKHLLDRLDWLRFVICKELCHALEEPNGKHDTSSATIIDLVAKFSIVSHQREVSEPSRAFHIEVMAEIGAVEILCPFDIRQEIVTREGRPDDARCDQLAAEFLLPKPYIVWAFSEDGMATVSDLIA